MARSPRINKYVVKPNKLVIKASRANAPKKPRQSNFGSQYYLYKYQQTDGDWASFDSANPPPDGTFI